MEDVDRVCTALLRALLEELPPERLGAVALRYWRYCSYAEGEVHDAVTAALVSRVLAAAESRTFPL